MSEIFIVTTTPDQLDAWLNTAENEQIEFKTAASGYDFDELVKYCVALANEHGGRLILGVNDARPRQVVGTSAFGDLEVLKHRLFQVRRERIEIEEVFHSGRRVLVFHVAQRPLGDPQQYKGVHWMRVGGSTCVMTNDRLQEIFAERVPDFSSEMCPSASLDDLDNMAVERLRSRWTRTTGTTALSTLNAYQLLSDAGLVRNGQLTNAALILLGKGESLRRLLAASEVIFEYRSSEVDLASQQRVDYRDAFFLVMENLWKTIALRNDMQSYQEGLFRRDIPTFQEEVVREAILNAVCHRDYRLQGSVMVKQFPRKIEIVSPGGFPPGVTIDNILTQSSPRNRLIAETFQRCGLVERSGQGVDRMFRECIRQAKPVPDYAGTDEYRVILTLRGEVQDPLFVRFLEKVGEETQAVFSTEDFLILNAVRRGAHVAPHLRDRVPHLVENGVLEQTGRGRGIRIMLSRRFYGFAGKRGEYTRRKGLDRATNKELIVKHLRDNRKAGSPLSELLQVLPGLSRLSVQGILRELKKEGRIRLEGATRGARWFPAHAEEDSSQVNR